MNDVTRQVGGSLGTAVIGSLVASFYGSRVSDAASGLPSGARGAVTDSIGSADAVAAQLPANQGAALSHAAASAFTDALGLGLWRRRRRRLRGRRGRHPAPARSGQLRPASQQAGRGRRAGRGCGMTADYRLVEGTGLMVAHFDEPLRVLPEAPGLGARSPTSCGAPRGRWRRRSRAP